MSDRASICILRACCDSLCRSCQAAGKVGQVFRRENLARIGGQVGSVRFNLLMDRCIGFSGIAENVVKDSGQLVDHLEPAMCLCWPRWMCCHPSQSHCGTLGNQMSDQHFQTIATVGANVGNCHPALECRRNDPSNWEGE